MAEHDPFEDALRQTAPPKANDQAAPDAMADAGAAEGFRPLEERELVFSADAFPEMANKQPGDDVEVTIRGSVVANDGGNVTVTAREGAAAPAIAEAAAPAAADRFSELLGGGVSA